MAHPNALNAKLGHAASIGGAAYVERVAFSDEVMGKLLAMDAAGRKKALAIVNRALAKAQASPRPSPRQRGDRVKVRWSDELIAKLKLHAPWTKDNAALARKLGLSADCTEAVRLARRRHCPQTATTRRKPGRPKIESPAAVLLLAA